MNLLVTLGALCGATVVLGAAAAGPASAHAHWQNGDPVPAWIQRACCADADIRHLLPAQVHREAGGYRVDGVREVIPFAKVLPSMDGDDWVFVHDYGDGSQFVFCLFVAPEGS